MNFPYYFSLFVWFVKYSAHETVEIALLPITNKMANKYSSTRFFYGQILLLYFPSI